MDTTYTGTLQISVVSALGMTPIPGATVTVSYTGDPDSPLETMTTDESGQTPTITLDAPPRELSLSPDITAQPYSEYNIQVTAEGFEPVLVSGSEILAGEFSLQPIRMNPLNVTEEEEKVVVIPAHTLFGEYPPKIPEEEIKPMNETGEIVLSRVVIPEYVIVHDGVPEDPTARNYWVRYKDYIKNDVYPDMSKEYCNLDIVALNKLIIDDVFHIDEEKYEDYVHSTRSYESCYKDIQDGKYDIMFIMNPVRVEQIRNITAMGERLPEVTISVFPKPSVGVIINLKED